MQDYEFLGAWIYLNSLRCGEVKQCEDITGIKKEPPWRLFTHINKVLG